MTTPGTLAGGGGGEASRTPPPPGNDHVGLCGPISRPTRVCFSPQGPPARTPSSPRCSGRLVNSVLPATTKSGGRLCGTWATPSAS